MLLLYKSPVDMVIGVKGGEASYDPIIKLGLSFSRLVSLGLKFTSTSQLPPNLLLRKEGQWGLEVGCFPSSTVKLLAK